MSCSLNQFANRLQPAKYGAHLRCQIGAGQCRAEILLDGHRSQRPMLVPDVDQPPGRVFVLRILPFTLFISREVILARWSHNHFVLSSDL